MAHRGASLARPANTMPAFAAAVAEGADVIETDVHWTADGVLVVAHDPVVETVSDGCGRIDEMTFQALRELDFGYRFSPDGGQTYPFRGKGVMIPTFLELLHAWPNVRVNVDLKPKRARVPAFLEVVDQASAFDRVTLASFHHRTLAEARSRCPKLATSASTREVVEFLAGIPTWKARLGLGRKVPYVALQVPNKAYGRTVVDARFVRRARAIGVEVHVWTVDDPDEMRRLIALGVDGIVTNSPSTLRKIVLDSPV